MLGCALEPANNNIATQPVVIDLAVWHISQSYLLRHTLHPTNGTFFMLKLRLP